MVCINKQKNEIPNFLKQSHNSFRKIEEEDSQIDRNTQLSIKLKKAKSLSFIKVNRDSVCSSTTIDELQKTCDMINILNSSKQSKILKNI